METKEPTPTIVHNYYGITFQNCSMPNATIQTISQPSADAQPAPAARAPEDALSDALRTPRAEALLTRLVDAGLVDASWQPLSLSNAEKGVLASLLADRLGVDKPVADLRPPVGHEAGEPPLGLQQGDGPTPLERLHPAGEQGAGGIASPKKTISQTRL